MDRSMWVKKLYRLCLSLEKLQKRMWKQIHETWWHKFDIINKRSVGVWILWLYGENGYDGSDDIRVSAYNTVCMPFPSVIAGRYKDNLPLTFIMLTKSNSSTAKDSNIIFARQYCMLLWLSSWSSCHLLA